MAQTIFMQQTGGEYPLFRVALAVSIVDDLIQLQVSSVTPTSDNWTILSSCTRDEIIIEDPAGLTEVTVGAVTLTYQNGIFIGNNMAVSPTRLGEWHDTYAQAVAFLIDALNIEVDAEEVS
jgi:hypothetical protein